MANLLKDLVPVSNSQKVRCKCCTEVIKFLLVKSELLCFDLGNTLDLH